MQKTVLIALAVVGTLTAGYFLFRNKPSQSVDVNPTALRDVYNQWKLNYKINVGAAEDDYRFRVFSSNYDQINQHNRLLGKTYKQGLNAFTHLTQEEFNAIYLGADLTENAGNATVLPTNNLKATVDWRDKMNPVKNQGRCGSCWAFSAVAAIEATHSVTKGSRLDLSEQELVDCSGAYGNMGCNGGLKDQAFRYVIAKKGLAAQKDYPYTAADGTCKTSGFQRIGKISSYVTVTPRDPEALKAALNIQPVAVSVKADTWKSYSSGIINDNSCGTATNHAVIAVGYNTEGSVPHYVVRNSWGPAWGESGHVRVGIQGGIGICGIQKSPFYPVA
jgi:hypothetical protein